MKIRTANKKDIKEIVKLINSAEELRETKKSKHDIKYISSHINNPMHQIYICEENNKIIGVLTAEVWKDKKYGFVSNIIMNKKFRKKGIGSLLFNKFEKYCKAKKFRKITFLTKISNKKMQKWSEKKGYKKGDSFYFYKKDL